MFRTRMRARISAVVQRIRGSGRGLEIPVLVYAATRRVKSYDTDAITWKSAVPPHLPHSRLFIGQHLCFPLTAFLPQFFPLTAQLLTRTPWKDPRYPEGSTAYRDRGPPV